MATMASFPSDTAPLAIVQWTHTLVMKPMLLLAREQILRSSFAEHHVVLHSCGDSSESCASQLQKVRPLVENVTCTNATDVANALPAFSTIRSIFKGRFHGSFMNYQLSLDIQRSFGHLLPNGMHPLDVGQVGWCWHSCDAPYLLWYSRIGRTLHHVQFFWFLEWDVVWTGDVTAVLSAWSALHERFDSSERVDVVNPSRALNGSGRDSYLDDGRRIYNHDLLCPNPGWAVRSWGHREKRNNSLVPHTHVHRCVTEVYRVTHRLLGAILDFSQQPMAGMFCEMRAASVCAMHPWCTMRSLFDRDHLRLFHTATRRGKSQQIADLDATAAAPSNAEVHLARTRWVASYNHDGGVQDAALQRLNRPMLFHAYKWNLSASPPVLSFAHRMRHLTRPFEEALLRDASAYSRLPSPPLVEESQR